jgi:hypothetical protein
MSHHPYTFGAIRAVMLKENFNARGMRTLEHTGTGPAIGRFSTADLVGEPG